MSATYSSPLAFDISETSVPARLQSAGRADPLTEIVVTVMRCPLIWVVPIACEIRASPLRVIAPT